MGSFEGLCLASPSSTWGRTCSSPSRGRRTEEEQGCQLQALGKSLSRASSPRTTMRGAGWSLPFPSHQGRKTPRSLHRPPAPPTDPDLQHTPHSVSLMTGGTFLLH